MKRIIHFLVVILLISLEGLGQSSSSFHIKAGLTNCTIKRIQEPPSPNTVLGYYGNRTGMQVGIDYSHKVNRWISAGADLRYQIKGYRTLPSEGKIYSDRYLSFAPQFSFFPFANSTITSLGKLSPTIGLDINYCFKTEQDWSLLSNWDFKKWEYGYTIGIKYQYNRFGIHTYYFRPLTPYMVIQNNTTIFTEYRYSFVYGISFMYKIF